MACTSVIARLRLLVLTALLVLGLAPEQAGAIEGPPIFSPVQPRSGAIGSGTGSGGGGISSGGILGDGIDFRGGMLDWEEDDEGNRVAILRNYAVVILPQLTISARNIVLNVEQQELYAEGDVLFSEASGNAFYCDQLTFNYEEWNGLAKNIRIKMDKDQVQLPVRDFLDERPSTSLSGNIGSSLNEARTTGGELKRMYVQAQELRAHDQNTFELINAQITPSSFARPHWSFHSPAALYRQREKIEAYHNTVRIGKFPVLYFPYLIRDLQYDWPWMRLSAGHTSDYGFFLRSQWGWRIRENPTSFLRMDKIIFDVDLFSNRGMGLGAETTYQVGTWDSKGSVKAYGVWEFLTSREDDRKRAYEKNADRRYAYHQMYEPSLYRGDFRWAFDWDHYQQLNDVWDVRAEAHLYHDRDYLKEYDPTRFWSKKEPENSIVLRRMSQNWEFELLASSRLSNKWVDQTEYLPEARLTVPGMQIGDTNLYFKNDLRVGLVNRRVDEDRFKYEHYDNQVEGNPASIYYPETGIFNWDPKTGHSLSKLYDKDNYGTMFRAVNEMRVEAPLKAGGFTLKPWVGLRTAYYSKTLGRDWALADFQNMTEAQWNALPYEKRDAYTKAVKFGLYDPELRMSKGKGDYDFALPFGAELSTRSYTFFGADDQWRLTSEPKFKWTENSRPHLDYNKDMLAVDYYDKYQRQRQFSLEWAGKLQKRMAGAWTRDVIDFSIGAHQYPRERDREDVNRGERWSELTADAILRLNDHLSLSGSISYDLNDSKTNRGILSADWRINKYLRTVVSHYQYRGNYWGAPDASASAETHLALRTKLWNDSSRYSFEGAMAYEWKPTDDKVDWSQYGVRHGFNKYRATIYRDLDTFEMSLSYMRDRKDGNQGVYFSLTPKSFMGYDRPPPQYNAEVEELAEGRYARQIAHFLDDGYRIDPPIRDADIKDIQF